MMIYHFAIISIKIDKSLIVNPDPFDVAVVEIDPGLAGVRFPKLDIRSTPVRANARGCYENGLCLLSQ
jgi:hypothetical protein